VEYGRLNRVRVLGVDPVRASPDKGRPSDLPRAGRPRRSPRMRRPRHMRPAGSRWLH